MNTLKLSAKTSTLLLAPLFVSTIANATPSLNDMGNIYSYYEISENGRLVMGYNTYQLWSGTSSTQYTVPGVVFTGVSGDGRILTMLKDNYTTPALYFTDTRTELLLPVPSGYTGGTFSISMDGSIIIGYVDDPNDNYGRMGAYWTYTNGQISNPIYTAPVYSGDDAYSIRSTNNNTAVGSASWSGYAGYLDWITNSNAFFGDDGVPIAISSLTSSSYIQYNIPLMTDKVSGVTTVLPYSSNMTGGEAIQITNDDLMILGSATYTGLSYSRSPIIWKRNSSSESFSAPIRLSSYTNASPYVLALSQATGKFAVGEADTQYRSDAIIWRTSDGYFANIGGLSGYDKNYAFGVSATGQFVYGKSMEMFNWSNNRIFLADLGPNASNVTFIAPDTTTMPSATPSYNSSNVAIVDLLNQNQTLINTGYELNSVLNHQDMVVKMGLGYDCDKFGETGLCVAVGATYSMVTKEKVDSSGVNVRIAKKLSDKVHAGIFVDKALTGTLTSNYDNETDSPFVGAFVGYAENQNGTGINLRASTGYSDNNVRITRNAGLNTFDTIAGSGNAHIKNNGIQAEASYGVKLNENLLLQPYLGLRQVNNTRSGYTEDTSSFAVTYNQVTHSATTGFTGAKLAGKITDNVVLHGNLGVEYDIKNHIDNFEGSYANEFGFVHISPSLMPEIKRTRLVSNAGADYLIDTKQTLSVAASQQSLSVGTAVNAMVTYTVAF